MNKNPSKKKLWTWIKEHVSPSFHLDSHNYQLDEDPSWSVIDKWKYSIKNRGVFGIKFRWKF
jgi:hypothetical protein